MKYIATVLIDDDCEVTGFFNSVKDALASAKTTALHYIAAHPELNPALFGHGPGDAFIRIEIWPEPAS